MIFFTVVGTIILSTAIAAAVESIRGVKSLDLYCIEEDLYPTKEEYEQSIIEIREEEAKSDKFIKISNFIEKYNKRDNIRLENKLFEIISCSSLKDNDRYNELEKFIYSLSEIQIKSNIYLNIAVKLLKTSSNDCRNIIEQLYLKMENGEVKNTFNPIYIDVDIPEETLKLLPTRIEEQKTILYYEPFVSETSCISLLQAEYRHIYTKYNEIVSKIDKLASQIYLLQIRKILSNNSQQIVNGYFEILNNSYQHKFMTSYTIKKDMKTNDLYGITNKEKATISKIVGLPFEEIIKMSIDELDEYLENKFGKKLNRDLEWTKVLSNDDRKSKQYSISLQIKK